MLFHQILEVNEKDIPKMNFRNVLKKLNDYFIILQMLFVNSTGSPIDKPSISSA